MKSKTTALNKPRQKNLTWLLHFFKMDSFQIKNILSKKLGSIFKGVYTRDQLLSLKMRVPTYVFNTKPGNSPGEQWFAVYVCHNRTAVYFDSFGLPTDQMTFVKCLKKHTVKWIYSMKMLQNTLTVVCREYCVVFLLHFHRF